MSALQIMQELNGRLRKIIGLSVEMKYIGQILTFLIDILSVSNLF